MIQANDKIMVILKAIYSLGGRGTVEQITKMIPIDDLNKYNLNESVVRIRLSMKDGLYVRKVNPDVSYNIKKIWMLTPRVMRYFEEQNANTNELDRVE